MFWHFVKSVVEIYLHNFSFPHRLTNTTWLAETFFRVTLMSEVTCRETTLPMRTHGNCEALQRCFLTLKTDFNANKKTHFCCVGFFGGDALRCFYCIIPCFWGYSAHCFCCRRPRLSCTALPWTRHLPMRWLALTYLGKPSTSEVSSIMAKICNINFWIENTPPVLFNRISFLGTFEYFFHHLRKTQIFLKFGLKFGGFSGAASQNPLRRESKSQGTTF